MKRIVLLLLISCLLLSCRRYETYRLYNSNKLHLIRAPKKGEQPVARGPIDKKIAAKSAIDTTVRFYEEAYQEMNDMLKGSDPVSFKRAVFLTENAYWNNELEYTLFCKQINELHNLCTAITSSRELVYTGVDKSKVSKHAAIYALLTDTLKIAYGHDIIEYPVFGYDFDDFSGSDDWTKMFVTKLISSHKGNCHSLPFLYKILAEEMDEDAYLSLAPNHIYIKLYNKQNGWYNTELTSGVFPIDAWLMASGYIHTDAIRSGIYMDTLGQKQSIAVCMTDLAQGYARKYGKDSSDFVLKACNTALRYYPNYINALLLRAETQKHRMEQLIQDRQIPYAELKTHPETKVLFEQLKSDYIRIHELGYRKMPDAMYMDWLLSLKQEKSKYDNKKISTFNPGTH
jgi:hypothetical protein